MAATEWENPVGTAIAAKLAGVTGIITATYPEVDNFSAYPAALVLIPTLRLTAQTGNYESWEATYECVIFPDLQGMVEATVSDLITLGSRIRLAWWDNVNLGLAYVTHSKLTDLAPELYGLADEDKWPVLMGHVVVSVTEYGKRT